MKQKQSFRKLLKKAAISTKRAAARKKQPFAISENGKIILVYPDKSRKEVKPALKRKISKK